MVDEQDSLPPPVQNEGRCGDVTREGGAGVNGIPVPDLPPQYGVLLHGNLEGLGMAVEQMPDVLAEDGWVEYAAHLESMTFANASL